MHYLLTHNFASCIIRENQTFLHSTSSTLLHLTNNQKEDFEFCGLNL